MREFFYYGFLLLSFLCVISIIVSFIYLMIQIFGKSVTVKKGIVSVLVIAVSCFIVYSYISPDYSKVSLSNDTYSALAEIDLEQIDFEKADKESNGDYFCQYETDTCVVNARIYSDEKVTYDTDKIAFKMFGKEFKTDDTRVVLGPGTQIRSLAEIVPDYKAFEISVEKQDFTLEMTVFNKPWIVDDEKTVNEFIDFIKK